MTAIEAIELAKENALSNGLVVDNCTFKAIFNSESDNHPALGVKGDSWHVYVTWNDLKGICLPDGYVLAVSIVSRKIRNLPYY